MNRRGPHIPIGKRVSNRFTLSGVMTFCVAVIFSVGISCPNLLAESYVAFPQLAIANSGNWSTEVFIGNQGAMPVTFETEACRIHPCYRWTVKPGEALRVASLPSGFLTLPAPSDDSYTLLRFSDGKTSASYAVPPMGALFARIPQTFTPIANDGELVTTVNVFPTGPSTITVEVMDSKGEQVASEAFDALPPVTQYQVRAVVPAGSIRITNGKFFGTPQMVFGFVAVTDRKGSNANVLPFGDR